MRWYTNLRMQAKLMLAFAATTALLLVVGFLGLRGMQQGAAALDVLSGNELVGVSASQDLRGNVLDVGRLYRQVLLDTDAEARRTDTDKVAAQLAAAGADLERIGKLHLSADEQTSLATLQALLPAWKAGLDETLRRANAGDGAGARAAAVANGANAVAMVKDMRELAQAFETNAAEVNHSFDRAESRGRILVLLVMVFAALGSLGLGFGIARQVSRPLGETARVLGRVAKGDFTQRLQLDTRDELGDVARALNGAIDGMRTSLREVRESAQAVAGASRELSASSESISAGAQEQAAALEETAASIEQIAVTVQHNADHSRQASQFAQTARDVAELGGGVVGNAVQAMSEINASSRRIADIITTIDEIAFQTNLLALNAAVEAARAGEQGRGFAVVASEVRNLAQRSASAAKEIKTLIEDSVEKVDAGTALVNQSGATLGEIVTAVKRVTEIVGEIAVASNEQSTGITQVGTAVGQMDQVTQSNAAQTEELAGTSEALAAQAEQLKAMVGRYVLDAGAQSSAAAPVVRAALATRKRAVRPVAASAASGTRGGFEEF